MQNNSVIFTIILGYSLDDRVVNILNFNYTQIEFWGKNENILKPFNSKMSGSEYVYYVCVSYAKSLKINIIVKNIINNT